MKSLNVTRMTVCFNVSILKLWSYSVAFLSKSKKEGIMMYFALCLFTDLHGENWIYSILFGLLIKLNI